MIVGVFAWLDVFWCHVPQVKATTIVLSLASPYYNRCLQIENEASYMTQLICFPFLKDCSRVCVCVCVCVHAHVLEDQSLILNIFLRCFLPYHVKPSHFVRLAGQQYLGILQSHLLNMGILGVHWLVLLLMKVMRT